MVMVNVVLQLAVQADLWLKLTGVVQRSAATFNDTMR